MCIHMCIHDSKNSEASEDKLPATAKLGTLSRAPDKPSTARRSANRQPSKPSAYLRD